MVRRFVADLCRVTHREELYLERVASKDRLREAIVAAAVGLAAMAFLALSSRIRWISWNDRVHNDDCSGPRTMGT